MDSPAPRLRVLAVTRIWPNKVEPLACAFQRQQLASMAKHCDLEVFGTIPKLAFAGLLGERSRAGRLAREVPMRDVIDGVTTVHPRVPYLPGSAAVNALAPFNAPLYLAGLLPHARDLKKRFDVVLGTFLYPDACAAAWLARAAGLPYVIKTHGTDVNVVSKWKSVRPIIRDVLKNAAFTIGVSQPMVDALVELGADRDRALWLKNGVDRDVFHRRDRDACRSATGLPAKGKIAVYVGRLVKEKGLRELLEAFALVVETRAKDDPAHLVFVGEGELRGEIEAAAKKLRDRFGEGENAPRIVLAGGQPLAKVAELVSASDLLVLPSWNEGTPNVVLEALACGIPIAATSVGGIPAVVREGVTGVLFPAKNVAKIARGIATAFATDWDAQTIAASAPPSWHENALELFGIIERAARGELRSAA